MRKSALLAAIQKEIQRHDLSYFVSDPPSVAQGGHGVVVAGCPVCRKRINTMTQFLDHLTNDVMPELIERLAAPKELQSRNNGEEDKMLFSDEDRVEQLRARFEGKEAIYIEKGALRVRVFNICGTVVERYISAEVEEIPTAGFPAGMFYELREYEPSPMRWSIGGGYLTTFSDHSWHAGYGGWSLYFAPRIVDGILSLALRFPDNLDPFQRYSEVLDYLKDLRPMSRLNRSSPSSRPE